MEEYAKESGKEMTLNASYADCTEEEYLVATSVGEEEDAMAIAEAAIAQAEAAILHKRMPRRKRKQPS